MQYPIYDCPSIVRITISPKIFLYPFSVVSIAHDRSIFNLAFANAVRTMSHLVKESPVIVTDGLSFRISRTKTNQVFFYFVEKNNILNVIRWNSVKCCMSIKIFWIRIHWTKLAVKVLFAKKNQIRIRM